MDTMNDLVIHVANDNDQARSFRVFSEQKGDKALDVQELTRIQWNQSFTIRPPRLHRCRKRSKPTHRSSSRGLA